MEKINLLCIGLSSYNYKGNVASDLIENGYFLPPENLSSQTYLSNISEWTRRNLMKLNTSKTKTMNFNFTRNFQCSTRLTVDGEVPETIRETKLLGVMLNNTLTWDSNTRYLVKRANARMRMLHKLVEFHVPTEDLVIIFICLKFAKACLKNENLKDMFPLNDDSHQNTREREVFKVTFAHKDRLKNSSIPYMQRLLNSNV